MKLQLMMGNMFLGTAIVGSALFAVDDQEPERVACPCPCEEVVCEPKPQKCIDCVCYNPPFYDLQCDCGAFVFAEVFAWYGRETNLPYAMQFTNYGIPSATSSSTEVLVAAPTEVFYNDACWDPGFRVGIGSNLHCDSWDVSLYWTYYHNKTRNSTGPRAGVCTATTTGGIPLVPEEDQSALLNPWVNASFVSYLDGTITFDEISAQWKLNFNEIDLEIGKKYWVSECFNIRPYASLRGAWTRTRFVTTSERTNINLILNFTDEFKNRNWGIGFATGFQPAWYFLKNFAVVGDIDGALLWGKFRGNNKETYSLERLVDSDMINFCFTNEAKNDFYKMMPMLDLSIRIRWEERWCNKRFLTAFDFGWEHHIWFDHGVKIQTTNSNRVEGTPDANVFNTFISNPGNLEFGGFVFGARFEF